MSGPTQSDDFGSVRERIATVFLDRYGADTQGDWEYWLEESDAILVALGLEEVAVVDVLGFIQWSETFKASHATVRMGTPLYRLGGTDG